MALPVPNLDDRRFQDLVDDAKRLVQRRCPEWTDHNVSDPGVTLIETFAFMVDQLLYRLNRMPERHYLRFLDLLGVRLLPPAAAVTNVTFWLSAPRPDPVTVPEGAEVASDPSELDDPVVFTTKQELVMVPCELSRLMTTSAEPGAQPLDRTTALANGERVACFSAAPAPGDTMLVGLSDAVPRCAVLLRLDCEVEGIGVDPTDPPLVWEAWTPSGWQRCDVDRDSTGGLNRAGDVVLHVPEEHAVSVIGRQRAGWLRCRIVEPEQGQAFYRESPRLSETTAATIGGTIPAVHAETIHAEELGTSEGTPGQTFRLQRQPVIASDGPVRIEVSGRDGWQEWLQVESFADSGPDDQHFTFDPVGGEIVFGPAVRQPNGAFRSYGAVPPRGAVVRVPEYRVGGGRRGNVAAGALTRQRDPQPFVHRVVNRAAAHGGVDAESVSDAAIRGPLLVRSMGRAVTPADFEQLAREAAREVARVRCVPNGEGPEAAVVRVLVIPDLDSDPAGRVRFVDLKPPQELLERVTGYLDQRRQVGTRLVVEPPFYQGITVVARIRARVRANPLELKDQAMAALYRYLHPLQGGPDGTGWPFGRPVQTGDLFAELQRLSGVELVEEIKLFPADPVTGQRGETSDRIDLDRHATVFSYEHHVRVVTS